MIKPKLNSYVWVAYKDFYSRISFTKVKVIAKGSKLFIHEGCIDEYKVKSFRRPIYYEDYNETWFKSLKEIRKKYKIKKIYDDYYEV